MNIKREKATMGPDEPKSTARPTIAMMKPVNMNAIAITMIICSDLITVFFLFKSERMFFHKLEHDVNI